MKCKFCENKSTYEAEINGVGLVHACDAHRRTLVYASMYVPIALQKNK